MRYLASKLILCTLLVSNVYAFEITLEESEGAKAIRLFDINYPTEFAEDLNSGLKTVILIQANVYVTDNAEKPVSVESSINVQFDLWDEVFIFEQSNNSNKTVIKITEKDILLEMLRVIEVSLPEAEIYTEARIFRLTVVIYINPISRERIELIRNFIAENTVPGELVRESSSDKTEVKASLFNMIFNEYIKENETSSIWSETATLEIEATNEK